MFLFAVLFMLFCGLFVFSSSRKHLISSLLSLEFMVLGIFILFFMLSLKDMIFYSLIYLVFSACEGALGLSILVMMGRSMGGDFLSVLGS